MSNTLVSGTFWSFLQRFGGMAISFISNMTLARLLCPEDFGTMGMIMVFVSFADVLVDGGLGNALIQKKIIEEKDTSTVFSANLLFSLFLFGLVFFVSPFIELYTKVDKLSIYLRVLSVMILTRALYTVPLSLLTKNMQFQSLAKINVSASCVSVIICIIMAYYNYGIWSLICRNIMMDILLVVCLFIKSKYVIKLGFDKKTFQELFNFGFFVVLSNIVENLYSNAVTFFTGKKYSVKELGYYNQAYSLQQIPIYSLTSVLNQVLFPYFSKIQDNDRLVKDKLKISIQMITFFVFPLLVFLICYAEQVIIIIYSEKWLPCIPYFRLFCLAGFFNALIHINRSLLKSKGYTKTIFNIQLINTVVGIILLLLFLQISMIATVMAFVANSIFLYILTAFLSGDKIDYNIKDQIMDVANNLIFAIIAAMPCLLFLHYIQCNVILITILGLFFFSFIYLCLHIINKTDVWNSLSMMIKTKIK